MLVGFVNVDSSVAVTAGSVSVSDATVVSLSESNTRVAVAVASSGVCVGRTRITGVLVGTAAGVFDGSAVGDKIGSAIEVSVTLGACSVRGAGSGKVQEVMDAAETRSRCEILKPGDTLTL